ncbi:MAG: L,D-transpeptidase family protein [Candidatus Omnitrophica bacterium]|nr:L,D-transpeptidase family protein [Candidatus Omnitrophota bacterium]
MKKIHIVIIVSISMVIIFTLIALSSKKSTIPKKTIFKSAVLKEAESAFSVGSFKEAKRLYQESLENVDDPNLINSIRQKIEDINIRIIFSKDLDQCSTTYVVQPKDTLTKISKKFKTTVSLIKRSNNLSSDTIRPKQKLKVASCEFSIVVDKSQNLLFLKRKGEVVKTYIVSTGKDNSTPVGKFTIDRNKLRNPTWFRTGAIVDPADPENILGSRWMGLEGKDANGEDIKGYGIHGTTKPQELGKQITLGCIRMRNQEVEELFDIVPIGTEVLIID